MIPLIIDTDPGVDDAFAIAIAARSQDVRLLGLTTVYGNASLEHSTGNALRLLELCERTDVPVAAGADRPLIYPHPHRAQYAHGADGLSGRADSLPAATKEVAGVPAVELMARALQESAEPITIAAIGPLTNIALLLAAYPQVKPKIDRIVLMGGGLSIGNVSPTAEFNIWSDPEAARRVLVDPEVPTVLVPMDLTYHCAVNAEWIAKVAGSGPLGSALIELTPDYRAYYQQALGADAIVLHDAVAVAEAIQPGILATMELPLDVECSLGPARGTTLVDRRRNAPQHPESAGGQGLAIAVNANLDEMRGFILNLLCKQD